MPRTLAVWGPYVPGQRTFEILIYKSHDRFADPVRGVDHRYDVIDVSRSHAYSTARLRKVDSTRSNIRTLFLLFIYDESVQTLFRIARSAIIIVQTLLSVCIYVSFDTKLSTVDNTYAGALLRFDRCYVLQD